MRPHHGRGDQTALGLDGQTEVDPVVLDQFRTFGVHQPVEFGVGAQPRQDEPGHVGEEAGTLRVRLAQPHQFGGVHVHPHGGLGDLAAAA